jgi:hypothetical protein
METQYSIVKSSTPDGLFSLVMRAWYTDEEGQQVTVASDVKTGIAYVETLILETQFVEQNGNIQGKRSSNG